MNRFEEIYANNVWQYGSGEGSLVENNRAYIRYLEGFLRQQSIQSVVEMGCGDWQFSRFIDWGKSSYQGFDVVPSVVHKNQQDFTRPGVSFHVYSGRPSDLPAADLLIVKDVLQHLSDPKVHEALKTFPRFRYALVTNCINPRGPTINRDIEDGDFRYLDLRLPPFSIHGREVFRYTEHGVILRKLLNRLRWRKHVLLISTQPQ